METLLVIQFSPLYNVVMGKPSDKVKVLVMEDLGIFTFLEYFRIWCQNILGIFNRQLMIDFSIEPQMTPIRLRLYLTATEELSYKVKVLVLGIIND